MKESTRKFIFSGNWFFTWPDAKCLSIPITKQVSAGFPLRGWWITSFASDGHMSLNLGRFKISLSCHENDKDARFRIGDSISIDIRVKRSLRKRFWFWKAQKPWETGIVWKLGFRVLTVSYHPKWAQDAHKFWWEMCCKYIEKPGPIFHKACLSVPRD